MVRGDVWRAMPVVYRPEAIVESYDLWVRMLGNHEFANLPEPLVEKRVHQNMTTMQNAGHTFNKGDIGVRRQLLAKMGLSASLEQMQIHERACYVEHRNEGQVSALSGSDLDAITAWFETIKSANGQTKLFQAGILSQMLDERLRALSQKV